MSLPVPTLVSPTLAQAWLNEDRTGTPVRDERVRELAAVMRAGAFLHGQHVGSVVLEGGRLLNGKHRLHAIVLLDRAQTVNVEYRTAPE